jgi:mono/diheme cytochrome c family protein
VCRSNPERHTAPFLMRTIDEMNAWKIVIPCLLASSLAFADDAPSKVAAASPSSGSKPYTVTDGNKVDNATLNGWRTWRALACERCHGAEQEGLVGPPLVESLKKLSKDEFHKTVMDGRPEKGMPPFSASKMVTDNWEGLYAYLKGRSDGAIKPGHVYAMDGAKK